MESTNIPKDKQDIKSKDELKNLKSDYFLQKIYDYLQTKKSLEIFRYNKNLQKRLNISIKNYKEYSEIYSSIEIELIPIKNGDGKFINIPKNEKDYFHIYFHESKEETKDNEINGENKVSKINIIIDYQVKSFKDLFNNCKCIELISFKKFYRNNIANMEGIFCGCSSLKQLNISNFNTNNVTNMSNMFWGCSSLIELNLTNFNTNNVTNMSYMFRECSSLKELNLSNFNTKIVTVMSDMFFGCSSLKELNLSNFYTNNVKDMRSMFFGCSEELKMKMKSLNKFNQDAFK